MNRLFFVFSCLTMLLSVACSSPSSDSTTPKVTATINKDDMVKILADVHLVEARLQESKLRRTDTTLQVPDSIENYYKMIFTKYQVEEKDFLHSFETYAADQKVFDEMYDQVIERISRTDARLR